MLTLRDGLIAEEWSNLLPRCAAEGPGLYDAIRSKLRESEAPGVTWELETCAPSFLKAFRRGQRRDYLVIRSSRLPEWIVAIGAHQYGTYLSVTRFLLVTERIAPTIRRMITTGTEAAVGDEFDVYARTDLENYTGLCQHVLAEAISDLKQERQTSAERAAGKKHPFGLG